jgi:WD40 repeat protein
MTGATLGPERQAPASPFSGLAHFTENQADLFFGRESERAALIGNLRAARLTILYAATGVGKSSLLRAGVLARLRQLADSRLREGEPAGFVPIVFDSWRDDPVQELIDELETEIRPYLLDGTDEPLPRETLEAALEAASARTGSTCLVMLDQAEEYLLYSRTEQRRPPFSSQLARCVNRRDLRVHFLLAVREDAYAAIGEAFVRELPTIYANHLALGHLDREQGRSAIAGPIGRFNATHGPDEQVEIEPALTEAVLDEVRTGEVVFSEAGLGAVLGDGDQRDGNVGAKDEIETPYLQLVMLTLWDSELGAGSHSLRLATFRRLGGASAIVRQHMHGVLDGLPPARQQVAADIFHHLVTPSGTKIVHRISDLAEYGGHDRDEVQRLVDDLLGRDQRLLRPIPPALGERDEPRVEIFHDVLAPAIVEWRALREETRLRSEARAAEAAAARERRRAAIFRAVAGAAVVLLIAAVVAFIAAKRETNRAHAARNAAERATLRAHAAQDAADSRLVASQASRYLLDDRLRPGSLLAIAANHIASTGDARASLVAASVRTAAMTSVVQTQTGGIDSVATSPDGRTVAVAGDNGTAELIDLSTHGTRTIAPGIKGQVTSVAYSPSGRVLALALGTHVVLWSVSGNRAMCTVTGMSRVESVAFSHGGGQIATGTDAGAALWNARTCHFIRRVGPTHAAVYSVAFSPGDRSLAVAAGRRVILTNLAGGRDHVLTGPSTAYGLAISPSGDLLAAAYANGRVVLWSLHSRVVVHSWRGSGAFEGVAFSPDGHLLAAASDDNTVRVWSPSTGEPVSVLVGHSEAVNSVSFGPGGTLVSGGGDGTMIAWATADLAPGRSLSSRGQALALAFDADGTLLAASSRASVRVWNLSSGRLTRTIAANRSRIETVAFDPTRPLLASADDSGTTVLSDLSTHRTVSVKDPGSTYALAFSPDGRTIATGGADDHVTLRSANTGQLIKRIGAQPNSIEALAFDRTGRYLAAADENGTLTLWRLPGYRMVARFRSSDDPVNTVAFNSSGTVLASGGADDSIVLWNPLTGHQLSAPLAGPSGGIIELAFDAVNPGRLLSVSQDGTVMDWDINSGLGTPLEHGPLNPKAVAVAPNGGLAAAGASDGRISLFSDPPTTVALQTVGMRLCRIVGGNLTATEWNQYEPSLGYRQQCDR